MKKNKTIRQAIATLLFMIMHISFTQSCYAQKLSIQIDSCSFMTIYDLHPRYRNPFKTVYCEWEEDIYDRGPALFVQGIIKNNSEIDCILKTVNAHDYSSISTMTLDASYSYQGKSISSEVRYLFEYNYDDIVQNDTINCVLHQGDSSKFFLYIYDFFFETGFINDGCNSYEKLGKINKIKKGKQLAKVAEKVLPSLSLRMNFPCCDSTLILEPQDLNGKKYKSAFW